MLDVMFRPPSVFVKVEWIAARVRYPDTDHVVLMFIPEMDSEPVWPGWWDSAEEVWRNLEGDSLGGSAVTWWADLPEPPAEPKPELETR